MTVEDYYIEGRRIRADEIDMADPAQRFLLDCSILCNDSTNENGVGIGMPLALSILKGQGGDIDVDFGGRGEGTTFILKFFK